METLDCALQKLRESKAEVGLLTPSSQKGTKTIVQKEMPPSFLNMNTIIQRNASLSGGGLERLVRI